MKHVTLDELQHLPDGREMFVSFGPNSPAYRYEMGPALRDYVVHRGHHVHGSYTDLACTHGVEVPFKRVDQALPCPGCHHAVINHPVCQIFSWLVVLCNGSHVKL